MALAAAQMGLRFVAVMPEGVSRERSLIIEAYGGEVVFSPRADGIAGSLAVAQREAADRGGFLPRQFSNPDNPAAHRYQTAREIIAQIPGGCVDAVVSGVGTGGTLVGLWHGFTDHGCAVKAFAARPIVGMALDGAECCSFSGRIPGVAEGLSAIYTGFHPESLVELDVPDDRRTRDRPPPDPPRVPGRTQLGPQLPGRPHGRRAIIARGARRHRLPGPDGTVFLHRTVLAIVTLIRRPRRCRRPRSNTQNQTGACPARLPGAFAVNLASQHNRQNTVTMPAIECPTGRRFKRFRLPRPQIKQIVNKLYRN